MAMNSLLVGFPLADSTGVPEVLLQGLQIAPVPGHLDGVADGPLHAAGRGTEPLGHLGVQHLGDGVDYIHVVYRKYDRLAQVLIALYVRRNADLVDDLGDGRFEICVAQCALGRSTSS